MSPTALEDEKAPPLKAPGIHTVPIVQRPPADRLKGAVLAGLFTLLLLGMHLSQLVLWPMSLVPGGVRELYWDYIRFSKESWTKCLLWISQKTTLVVTVDDSIDLATLVERDEDGTFKAFKFPQRTVWISNHQMYADWIYSWCLFSYANLHGAMVIVLKASLRNVPIGGPAMRLWKFIFLSGSWESDQAKTGDTLTTLGRRATKHDKSLSLLLYPEGTLVSVLTRPKSKKFAEKLGIPDMKNTLLPRSTGLLYCVRTLLPVAPDLAMYDMTVGYPGLPPAGYAQSYYTLMSIYAAGQAPPEVHIHIRALPLASVPTGAAVPLGKTMTPSEINAAVTPEERTKFDEWLRARWQEKDAMLQGYYETGHFAAEKHQRVEVKLGLKGIDDWVAVGANLVPLYAAYRLAAYAYATYL
ncbi:hypothetical protein RQP46_000506 [Phenoliferia psychrophenolica]